MKITATKGDKIRNSDNQMLNTGWPLYVVSLNTCVTSKPPILESCHEISPPKKPINHPTQTGDKNVHTYWLKGCNLHT